MALAISLAAQMRVDAMESTFLVGILYTWIPRIRNRVWLVSLSTALWMFSWGMCFTPSSLGLGHKAGEGTTSNKQVPVWRVDLRSVGFTGFSPKQDTWSIHLEPNPLSFTDTKVLVATFITREDVTTLARRDQPGEPLPLRLHGIFLDADVGKVRTTKEWSITRPHGGIVAAGEGRFLVLTPDLVAVYSPAFDLVRKFKLSAEQQSHLWDFHVSPSGKSILVEYQDQGGEFQWLDTDSLQPQPAWREILTQVAVSDNGLAFEHNPGPTSAVSHIVLFRQRDGTERTVCRVLVRQMNSRCDDPEFISNDIIALLGFHEFTLVARIGGDPLLQASFRQDEWLGFHLYPSADGKRLAVTIWEHQGGSALFDIDSRNVLKRIEVYDVSNPTPIYTLDAKQQKIKYVSGVALSPDGSLMAIMADGVVETYQLPGH
jgi:hypothetical protein